MATQQAMEALARGNEIRMAMAQLKVEVKQAGPAGLTVAAELLEGDSAIVDRMKVGDLLLAAPRVGQARAMRFLKLADLPMSVLLRKVGTLTTRQRLVLAATLRVA
jgi:hypothetical protein